MENLSIERLEKLKDVMILNHLAEVDLDNKSNYYDTLLYKTFTGWLVNTSASVSTKDITLESTKKKTITANANDK